MIVFEHFVYTGFSFYGDFGAYINTLVKSFKPEPFIIWSESAAKKLDPLPDTAMVNPHIPSNPYIHSSWLALRLYC